MKKTDLLEIYEVENETLIDTLSVDLAKKKVIEHNIKPTQIIQKDAEWLYAENNKYPENLVDIDKVGKWMVFVPKKRVNYVWDKIKKGILAGELWHAKVSTLHPKHSFHAIMIYTKDYTDLADVIRVLDYLEEMNIKLKHINIRYKTDQQTRAGIYSGGKERPWIYASETIRAMLTNDAEQNIIANTSETSILPTDKPADLTEFAIPQKKISFKQSQTKMNLFQPKAEKSAHRNKLSSASALKTTNYFAILQEEADADNEKTIKL